MRTSNTEHPTSNIEVQKKLERHVFTSLFDVGSSMLEVRCSMFDVRIDFVRWVAGEAALGAFAASRTLLFWLRSSRCKE